MVDEPLPWRHWLGMLRDANGDVCSISITIASFFRDSEAPVPSTDALQRLWQVWTASSLEGKADLGVLLLLVTAATQSERVLASNVLRCSRGDAARDLLWFAQVAERWCDVQFPFPTTNLWLRLKETANVLLPATHDDVCEDVMTWEDFTALPCTLELSVLQKTKDGRALIQHIDEIVAVEAWRLTEVTSTAVASTLQEAVERLEKCIPTESTASVVEDGYTECQDLAAHGHLERSNLQDVVDNTTDTKPQAALERLSASNVTESSVVALLTELETIDEAQTLSIRVAAALEWQRQKGVALVGHVSRSLAREWEQSIRKTLNSLTKGSPSDQPSPELLHLMRLAALDATTVLDVVIESMTTTSHHHQFIAQLLWWCPALVRWRSDNKEPLRPSQLIDAFVREITRIAISHNVEALVEEAPGYQCLIELSVFTAVFEPDEIVDGVFWEALQKTGDPRPVTRFFGLVHRYFETLAKSSRRCSSDLLVKSLGIVYEQYKRFTDSMNKSENIVQFRDISLLLCRDILQSTAVVGLDDWRTDIPMQTLLEVHGGRKPEIIEDELTSARPVSITSAITMLIEHNLWSLVWATEAGKEYLNFSQCVVRVAACEFVDSSGSLIAGMDLIQVQLTKLLLASGRTSFHRILRMVETVHLPRPCERTEESETSPALMTPRDVMDYAVRCWCIAAFSSPAVETDVVVRLLDYTLQPVDHAIESATKDPHTLRHCLHVIGLFNAWLSTKSDHARAHSLMNRVQIAAVRILFLICQLPPETVEPQEQASFRHSIAIILSTSTLLDCDTVVRFLRTTARSS